MCAFAVLMDSRPITPEAANTMLYQLSVSPFDKASIYYHKNMAFIQGIRFNTIESEHEVLFNAQLN